MDARSSARARRRVRGLDRFVTIEGLATMQAFDSSGMSPSWCRRGDSNPHRCYPIRPSSARVYQFHHFGTQV